MLLTSYYDISHSTFLPHTHKDGDYSFCTASTIAGAIHDSMRLFSFTLSLSLESCTCMLSFFLYGSYHKQQETLTDEMESYFNESVHVQVYYIHFQ